MDVADKGIAQIDWSRILSSSYLTYGEDRPRWFRRKLVYSPLIGIDRDTA